MERKEDMKGRPFNYPGLYPCVSTDGLPLPVRVSGLKLPRADLLKWSWWEGEKPQRLVTYTECK